MAMCASMTHAPFTTEERLRRAHATMILVAELHRLAATDAEGISPEAAIGVALVATDAVHQVEQVLSTMSADALNSGATHRRNR